MNNKKKMNTLLPKNMLKTNKKENFIIKNKKLNYKSVSSKIKSFQINNYNNNLNKKLLKFYIFRANNGILINNIISTKNNWKKGCLTKLDLNFIWKSNSKNINFNELEKKNILFNHYEFSYYLTKKDLMYYNIKNYCEKKSININEFLPNTFIFNMEKINFEKEIIKFSKLFKFIENKKEYFKKGKFNNIKLNFNDLSIKNYNFPFDFSKLPQIREYKINKINLNDYNNFKINNKDLFKGHNWWLIKPTSYNRGNGVNIFSKLIELNYFINKFSSGNNENIKNKLKTFSKNDFNINNNFKINSNSFIIQKYIENPLLINNRKFDIRIWVMIDQNMKAHIYKNGYIRTSSYEYSLKSNEKLIHLTNDAVQKLCKTYGKFEESNKMNFKDFENYIQNNINKDFLFNKWWNQIENIIKISLLSVQNKINKNKRKNCFELFGYDFMIDNSFKTYLIEINNNPCLDNSSILLNLYIPKMLNELIELTVNKYFDHFLNEKLIINLNNLYYNKGKIEIQNKSVNKIKDKINNNWKFLINL